MNIRAVVFDFGGVICFPPSAEQWQEAAQFCGSTTDALYEAFWKNRDGYDAGADATQYWQNIASILGLSFDGRMIAGMIQREIAFWSKFDPRVLNWARELSRAGIRTCILSNLPRPLGEHLRVAPGFIDHFDHVTFSYELGVIKPNPAIYRHAIDGVGFPPQECLFLDDRPENIAGSEAAGLQSERFASWEDFTARQLSRYNLPRPPG